MSDTVITGVPSKGYKVKTDQLRDGVVAVNFSSEKNFEANIKDKVRDAVNVLVCRQLAYIAATSSGINLSAVNRQDDYCNASTKLVRIARSLKLLPELKLTTSSRLRLVEYQKILDGETEVNAKS